MPVKMLKISFGIKSNVFSPSQWFWFMFMVKHTLPWQNVRVNFELFRRFTQTGNNNSTKILLPVRRRGRTRAREWRRERARPLRSVTCWTRARIGVRTQLTSEMRQVRLAKQHRKLSVDFKLRLNPSEFCLDYECNIWKYLKFKNPGMEFLLIVSQNK